MKVESILLFIDLLTVIFLSTSFLFAYSIHSASQYERTLSYFPVSSIYHQIPDWDVSRVKIMTEMFSSATSFNGLLTNWKTTQVHSLNYMFVLAKAFNQPVSHFDTSKVTNMCGMFQQATLFDQNLENWNTERVTDMKR